MTERYTCVNCGRAIQFIPGRNGGRFEHVDTWQESCGLMAEPKR